MLSQEKRIELQTLICHPEVRSIEVSDKRSAYGEIYSEVTIHIYAEVEVSNEILSLVDGLSLGSKEEFYCDHSLTSSLSIGHVLRGNIEGCQVTVFATREIKKEAPQQEGATEKQLTSDYTEMEVAAQ